MPSSVLIVGAGAGVVVVVVGSTVLYVQEPVPVFVCKTSWPLLRISVQYVAGGSVGKAVSIEEEVEVIGGDVMGAVGDVVVVGCGAVV